MDWSIYITHKNKRNNIMFVIDRLSTRMKIDYMALYHKTINYHHAKYVYLREDLRAKIIFSEKERNFLACFALEYLKQQGNKFLPDTPIMNCTFKDGKNE